MIQCLKQLLDPLIVTSHSFLNQTLPPVQQVLALVQHHHRKIHSNKSLSLLNQTPCRRLNVKSVKTGLSKLFSLRLQLDTCWNSPSSVSTLKIQHAMMETCRYSMEQLERHREQLVLFV